MSKQFMFQTVQIIVILCDFIKVDECNYGEETVYTYKEYCNECVGIEMLEEDFEMIQ